MSSSIPISGVPVTASRDPRIDTRNFLILMWAVALFSLHMGYGFNSLSTDDAMRLVGVRDFLAGQGWFDRTQLRLNPPAGIEIHWSRLVDLPLAVLIRSGSMLVTRSLAEQIVLALWPSALLLVFLAGVSRLACALAGHTAARIALVFSVLMAQALQHFRTGAIDHHNVQLVLLVWSLAAFARLPWRPRDAAIAGGLGALAIAIGQEMVPAVAILAAVAGVRWVVDGGKCARTTVAYAISLAAGAVILDLATNTPARYLVVDCDTISIAQVGTLGLGGFGLAALARIPHLHSRAGRLTAAGALAALLAACLTFGAPECLNDPYAKLDPRIAELWLSAVSEARNFVWMLSNMPQKIPVHFGLPLAAFVLATIQCTRERSPRRWGWIACSATQVILVLFSAWELRFTAGANAMGAVLFPAALLNLVPASEGRPAYLGISRTALVALLVLNPIALLAGGNAAARVFGAATVATQRIVKSGDTGTCARAANFAPLATLPRGRMLAFIDAGPFILMESSHAVFAAPYHRNTAGNIAMFDMFLAAPSDAKTKLAAHDIRYVVFCTGAPERYAYASAAPDSLASVLSRNEIPDFLTKLPLSGTNLVVYRVVN